MKTSATVQRDTELADLARTIRREIIQMTTAAGSGHPTSSFSATELLIALYFRVLRYRAQEPEWPDRDRFILSKGHAAPLLYAVLAHAGYFPTDLLMTLRKLDSPLQGHPEKRRLAGVEASTGSLGQGISIGIGMALAARIDRKDYRTYVLTGDGEIEEGQVWEAAMFAGTHKLDNLCVIVDANKLQQDGWVKETLALDPLVPKWEAFGWQAIDIDGHDFAQILNAYEKAKTTKGKPTVIIARTVKGKGVGFIENRPDMHGVPLTKDEMARALAELAA
ncbi:MAG: transketolase [Nitrospirota bacterium]